MTLVQRLLRGVDALITEAFDVLQRRLEPVLDRLGLRIQLRQLSIQRVVTAVVLAFGVLLINMLEVVLMPG